LYKQAGNAIVVDVLYYIFKQFIKGERKWNEKNNTCKQYKLFKNIKR
jgi:hypothetical protein